MDTPRLVRWTRNLEDTAALDGAVRVLEPLVDAAFATGRRGEVLRGDWLGHAVHPVLTDVVLGTWTSATILDLVGGRESRPAAQRLLGVSLLAVGPTAWTGWAEWASAADRDKRVGVVHAATNAVAIGIFASSWLARRPRRPRCRRTTLADGRSGRHRRWISRRAPGRRTQGRDARPRVRRLTPRGADRPHVVTTRGAWPGLPSFPMP